MAVVVQAICPMKGRLSKEQEEKLSSVLLTYHRIGGSVWCERGIWQVAGVKDYVMVLVSWNC